jgi:hypothetical protein
MIQRKFESTTLFPNKVKKFRRLLSGPSQLSFFSTKGFCPNFITKATKLQGSNIKEKKKRNRRFNRA